MGMQKSRSVFAMRLRVLRRAQHMTQDDVARELNIHRTTYTKYESDAAAPEQSRLLQLAELFHVSVDFLLGKTDAPTAPSAEAAFHDDTLLTLDRQEQALVDAFRQMDEHQKAAFLRQLTDKAEAEL